MMLSLLCVFINIGCKEPSAPEPAVSDTAVAESTKPDEPKAEESEKPKAKESEKPEANEPEKPKSDEPAKSEAKKKLPATVEALISEPEDTTNPNWVDPSKKPPPSDLEIESTVRRELRMTKNDKKNHYIYKYCNKDVDNQEIIITLGTIETKILEANLHKKLTIDKGNSATGFLMGSLGYSSEQEVELDNIVPGLGNEMEIMYDGNNMKMKADGKNKKVNMVQESALQVYETILKGSEEKTVDQIKEEEEVEEEEEEEEEEKEGADDKEKDTDEKKDSSDEKSADKNKDEAGVKENEKGDDEEKTDEPKNNEENPETN